jgi:hypothetical protein
MHFLQIPDWHRGPATLFRLFLSPKAAVLAVLLLAVSPVDAAEKSDLSVEDSGWRDLFAADLSDAQFPPGVWTVQNGELTASEDQIIWSRDEHSDFVLDFEFKTGPDANSGVLVYATDTGNCSTTPGRSGRRWIQNGNAARSSVVWPRRRAR